MNTTTKATHQRCWNCTQPARNVFTREGSTTLHACDYHTRVDRTEAESRGWTVAPLVALAGGEEATTQVVYRIVSAREVAPGWFSAPFEVGETTSATVAVTYCDAQNAVSMNPNRAVRKQYYVESTD